VEMAKAKGHKKSVGCERLGCISCGSQSRLKVNKPAMMRQNKNTGGAVSSPAGFPPKPHQPETSMEAAVSMVTGSVACLHTCRAVGRGMSRHVCHRRHSVVVVVVVGGGE